MKDRNVSQSVNFRKMYGGNVNNLINAPIVYLAGAMRNNRIEEDVEWREQIITECEGLAVFLNPLAGKSFNVKTEEWDFCGLVPDANLIVQHDFWCVERADIILFNFKALSQGYANIGTLTEFGHGTNSSPRKLLWSIINQDYTGHDHATLFKLHPFLEKNSAIVFHSFEEALEKVPKLLSVMSGKNPHFAGLTES